MLEAMLHGKLSREQENMEDILTSNVFGLMKYLPPLKALIPFLARAEIPAIRNDLPPNLPLQSLEELSIQQEDVTYDFWPMWPGYGGKRCEPDVVIRIDTPKVKVSVLVEAKYHSGKSGEADEREDAPPNDQLAREWHSLVNHENDARTPVLVYLTADVCMPQIEIANSVKEYRDKQGGPGTPNPVIAWLSWRHLTEIVEGVEDVVGRDLKSLLERLGLFFFRGMSDVATLPSHTWRFTVPEARFAWESSGQFLWRFKP